MTREVVNAEMSETNEDWRETDRESGSKVRPAHTILDKVGQ